jgi:hypothetical protein
MLPLSVAVGDPEGQHWTVVDEIVATINNVPVLRSDVQLEADFGLLEPPNETGNFKEMLDSYLNRLLILNEIDDIGGFRLTDGQAENAYLGYMEGFNDRTIFESKLKTWGIDEKEVYRRLERALLASLYTESRIRFFVKVVPSDIENAYAENPQRWGDVPIFEVWESIKSELTKESFEREMNRWLDSLRERYRLSVFEESGES